ncbi:MAG: Unknown protein [uncultured Sulfurovum sp.]|uniref:Uncharacterized protein n=1 Tax=uncultured Sulfurovum sp. TaxID=269237 RepID=A0A6S6RXF9_9BACT|nr:MAG: Unknown protein [uncultured Sulfurovum sp.]
MESIIWLVIIFGAGYLYHIKNKETVAEARTKELKKMYGSSQNYESTLKNRENQDVDAEAKKIADNIKTHRGLEGLQDKIDAAQDKLDDYHYDDNETMYARTERKMEILEKALDYAEANPYRYYYDAIPDIDTPLQEFKLMGKTISVQKFHELEPLERDKYDVISLSDVDNLEDANEYAKDNISLDEDELKDLIKFRTIIESQVSEEEKENKLEILFKKSEYLLDELGLDTEENVSLYEQYRQTEFMTEKLSKLYPLPYADYFIKEGIEDMEIIKNFTDEEILAVNGIGDARLKDIRSYLDGVSMN